LSTLKTLPKAQTARLIHLVFVKGSVPRFSPVRAIDYTPMPSSSNSIRVADSRVVLKIGGECSSVERGQTVADKRKCEAAQLPKESST